MARYIVPLFVLAALVASTAWALEPGQVVVVANADDKDSVEIAQAYAKARGIPDEQVVMLKTTAEYEIARAAYDKQIAGPLLAALADRKLTDKVRSLCLIRGIPVRVAGDREPDAAAAGESLAFTRAQYRLAVDYKYISSIGRSFPAPQTDGLSPVAKLFDPVPAPSEPLMKLDDLKKEIANILVERQKDFNKIKDAQERKIAERQLLAMHTDIYGLQGLIYYIKDNKPADAPPQEQVQKQLDELQKKLDAISRQPVTAENAKARLELLEQVGGLTLLTSVLSKTPAAASGPVDAAVDSELAALLWKPYPLAGSQPNPLFYGSSETNPQPTLMAVRIDGPTKADCLRIIADSVAAQKVGLKGTFYVDAGGGDKIPASTIAAFDPHMVNTYAMVRQQSSMKAVLDEKYAVFAPDTCPDTALYVGWYSLQKYVPAFKFNQGAVGWHVASWEAMHLRDPKSQEWCPRLIQDGISATLGAVNEPYLNAFPLPEAFFALLMTGKYTVAECYWRTVPQVSWRITFIGDPLYNPFQANPQMALDKVPKFLLPQATQPTTRPASQPTK